MINMDGKLKFEPTILELTDETIKDQLEEMSMDIDYILSAVDDNPDVKHRLMLANRFIFDARMKMIRK